MSARHLMLVGVGDLGGHVLHLLAQSGRADRITLAGRDEEYLHRKANLARYVAAQLGFFPEIEYVRLDLESVDQTAATIARVRPDIIFNSASLQSWRVITLLPKPVFEELDTAQFGPWLPMHLAPMYALMRAVEQSGHSARVVNAAFPDAVNPALARAGLAPAIGIGNVANMIPALRYAAGAALGAPPRHVQAFFVAQHYVSHWVPRFGYPEAVPFDFRVSLYGQDCTDRLDVPAIFDALPKRFRRIGGAAGQVLTAGSAAMVLLAMLNDTGELMHAPGVNGLPGGYPVAVGASGGEVVLPAGLSLDEAVRINEEGQRADGIDAIEADGTVRFTEQEMAVMKRMLDYECRSMRLADCAAQAGELKQKFTAFAARHG